jgi:DNA polymerase sigma
MEKKFNYQDLGICIRNGGQFFQKHQRNFQNNENLCVENFQDTTIDIGKSAYQFPQIRRLFSQSLNSIYKVQNNQNSSYLSSAMIIVDEKFKNIHESTKSIY